MHMHTLINHCIVIGTYGGNSNGIDIYDGGGSGIDGGEGSSSSNTGIGYFTTSYQPSSVFNVLIVEYSWDTLAVSM